MQIRARLKKIRKNFKRTEWNKRKKLGEKWRRAKGRDNKIRRGLDGVKVKVGYGTPVKVRSIHPSGLKEVIVGNLDDLKKIDKKTTAVRISSTVGLKKRTEILKQAKKEGIKVLNASLKARRAKLESKKEAQKTRLSKKETKKTSDSDSKESKKEENEKRAEEKPTEAKTTKTNVKENKEVSQPEPKDVKKQKAQAKKEGKQDIQKPKKETKKPETKPLKLKDGANQKKKQKSD